MSRLEEKLSVFERNCDMVTDSQVVLIISALRKALEQRNERLFAGYEVLKDQLDAEILQILEGEG